MGLNHFSVQGNITADPSLFTSEAGNQYTRFTVAWNSPGPAGKREASFFNCVAYGKTAEIFCEHMTKGRQVIIEGEIRQDNWTDDAGEKRTGFTVHVRTFHFINDGQGDGKAAPEVKPKGRAKAAPADEDDVAF